MNGEDIVLKELLGELEALRQKVAEFELQEARTRRWIELVQRVNALKEDLLTHGTLDEKLKRITDGLVEIFGADFARIWITKPGDRCHCDCVHAVATEGPHVCGQRNRCLHLIASSGRYTHIDGELHRRVPFDCYKIGRIASGSEAKFLTNDVANDLRIHNQTWARELGLVSFAGYRLLSEDAKPVGVMAVFSKCALSSDEAVLLESLANTTSQVVQTAMAEEARRESEYLYRSLVETSPDPIIMYDLEGNLITVNQQAATAYGVDSPEQLLAEIKNVSDILDYESQKKAAANIQRTLDAGSSRKNEYAVMRKDGGTFQVEINSSMVRTADGAPVAFISVVRDITARKSAEEQLRKSEEEFRRIIDNLQDLFYRADMDGKFIFLSPASERVLGYKPEEALGLAATKLYVDPSERAWFMEHVLENGFVNDFQTRLVHKNGEVVWISTSARLYKDGDGNIAGVEGIVRDISDRKRMEIALSESDQIFRLLSEQSLMSVAILQDGVYRYANEAMASLLEYSVDEILSWRPEEFLKVVHPDDRSLILQQARMKQAAAPEQKLNYSFRAITKSGAMKWVEIYSKTVQFKGRPANLITMMDITERKLAEQERNISAQRLEALTQLGHMTDEPLSKLASFAMEEAVRLTGSSIGYVAFANEDESVLTMHAWSQEAMRQCSIGEKPIIYPVQDTGLWGEAVRQRRPIVTNDYAAPNPWKKGTPDGHVQVLRHMNVPIFDDGKIVIVAGVGNKIVDYDENDLRQLRLLMEGMWRIVRRKFVEEALQESEDRFRIAFQTSPDAVNINRLSDGHCIDVNSGFTELTGYTRDDVIGKSSLDINLWHDPADRERVVAELKTTGHVRNAEAKFQLKDGRVRTGLMSARIIVLDGEPHILSVTRDVDDWKKAEEALFESEKRYKDLFDNATDLIYTHDLEGNFTSFNEAFTRVLGYTPEECMRLNVKQIVDPDYLPMTQEKLQEKMEGTFERSGPYEVVVAAKDGHTVNLEISSRLLTKEGKVVGVHGTARDITARKEAEAERSRLVTAIEQTGESILITDPAGRILYANPAFEETTGYSNHEVLGKTPAVLKSGKHDRDFYQNMWSTIRSGNVWRGRFGNKKKDGTFYEETATISPIRDEAGRVLNYVKVGRDMTTEIMLQKQLLQAQKMEAVGTLAGGIAHDFNNLLQAILGCADLLLMERKTSDADRQKLEIIHHAAKDGADLISRILTFSRRGEAKTRPTDLNEEIRRAEKLLRRTVPKMIEIKLALAEDLRIIDADPAQLEQVLLNLAVNAQHAMQKGGQLLIETSNVSLTDEYLRAHLGAKPGHYVRLTVSDTGVGITAEVMERIFEPFFTTKTDGEGTGLGLSMVHGIVSQHGGYIRCYSEPGGGTSFKIYFPVSASERMSDLTLTREMPAFGTETILLVDDDDRVREMAEEMIQLGGYQVISARSGEEALAIYIARRDEISLVILDLIMPGMGGKNCLEDLLRIDPNVMVLIASGYSPDGLTRDVKGSGAKGFVNKPYDSKDILTAIRKVLDDGHV